MELKPNYFYMTNEFGKRPPATPEDFDEDSTVIVDMSQYFEDIQSIVDNREEESLFKNQQIDSDEVENAVGKLGTEDDVSIQEQIKVLSSDALRKKGLEWHSRANKMIEGELDSEGRDLYDEFKSGGRKLSQEKTAYLAQKIKEVIENNPELRKVLDTVHAFLNAAKQKAAKEKK